MVHYIFQYLNILTFTDNYGMSHLKPTLTNVCHRQPLDPKIRFILAHEIDSIVWPASQFL